MEGTGEGCGFFCSPKLPGLVKYNVSTILSPIAASKKERIFVVVIHGLVALGAFTSKSCVGREINVIKSVIHVQSCCFADKSNCFSTLSLSSASSLTVLCLLHDWSAVI